MWTYRTGGSSPSPSTLPWRWSDATTTQPRRPTRGSSSTWDDQAWWNVLSLWYATAGKDMVPLRLDLTRYKWCWSNLESTSGSLASWKRGPHTVRNRDSYLLIDNNYCENTCRYDADYNHGPTLRKGHSAHWAVIHGVVIPSVPVSLLGSALSEEGNDSDPDFRVLNPNKLSASMNIILSTKTPCTTSSLSCVIAHHGKSMRPAVWNFHDLMASNQNLVQVSQKIAASPAGSYIFGDIETELCSKLVLLQKSSDTLC